MGGGNSLSARTNPPNITTAIHSGIQSRKRRNRFKSRAFPLAQLCRGGSRSGFWNVHGFNVSTRLGDVACLSAAHHVVQGKVLLLPFKTKNDPVSSGFGVLSPGLLERLLAV